MMNINIEGLTGFINIIHLVLIIFIKLVQNMDGHTDTFRFIGHI